MMLARYFYFRTPQFVYYVIPMSVLVADARHDRRLDEEQRAAGDAGVRHQPVSRGAAAAVLRSPRRAACCS